ncbi:MAG: DUF885 family protein [Acidobacteria bacterium]|nr:DUF885 family protein [Acidobacteriota bacterium]
MRRFMLRRILQLAILMLLAVPTARADDLDSLARDFWAWRTANQPFSQDDIPRLERPVNWKADWSPEAFASRRTKLLEFESRWRGLNAAAWPVPQQVDYRLIGSAIARVRWELEISPGWRRNPSFYIDQTMGAIFRSLLLPPHFDDARTEELLRRYEEIPLILDHARKNLDQARAPFSRLAMEELKDVRVRMETVGKELAPLLSSGAAARLNNVNSKAIEALENYREWLKQKPPSLPKDTAVGREAYVWFLKNVALIPYSPEQLLEMGRQEFERAASFEIYERARNQGLPELKLFATQAEQQSHQAKDEAVVRRYLEEKGILSIPSWLGHYHVRPLPAYLKPLASLGVTDDLTSPTRLKENGVNWFPPPSPSLGYFELASAKDPRTAIVHEGCHYMQLAISWAHENPIRRHYYDSGPNEGLAFYNEEMMLQAGLFDDSPRTREIIYNMMRLRALRVEVDVKLALGLFTIEQGGEYLRTTVPMDSEKFRFCASCPTRAARKAQNSACARSTTRFGKTATSPLRSRDGNYLVCATMWIHWKN